jgi:two-component system sensor histidine kinase UhpB
MNLATRIMLLILAVVAAMVLSGALLVIKNARESVANELDANAEVTMKLLSAVFLSSEAIPDRKPMDILLDELGKIDQLRDLNLTLRQAGFASPRAVAIAPGDHDAKAPAWFEKMVSPGIRVYRQQFDGISETPVEITITPDPRNEIGRVWKDTRTILVLIGFFTALSIVLTWLIVRRALRPVHEISSGLDIIQDGNYKARLPAFDLPELNQLSQKFNHMASVLDRQKTENKALSRRMLQMLEANQRHMAQELHDELGQSITAIKAQAASLMQSCPDSQRGANAIVDICNHMYSVVRGMMNRLRPVVLDELGLVTAIERLVDGWNSIHENTFAALSINGDFTGIDDEISIHIYRIVQEALTNIAKHARATNVTILLQRGEGGRITLHIEDDGQGFNPQTRPLGMGLSGMQNRADSCNGNLSLVGTPGRGVKIDLIIPATTET